MSDCIECIVLYNIIPYSPYQVINNLLFHMVIDRKFQHAISIYNLLFQFQHIVSMNRIVSYRIASNQSINQIV